MTRRLYTLTSIARPLEPGYPTNLAVLLLVPLAALLAAWMSIAGIHAQTPPLRAAITTALAAFGAWAVTREFAPDDNPAAFVSMLLAVAASVVMPFDSLLPLFVTLLLVRIVNHSTGLPPTLVDALLVTCFAAWAAWNLGAPLIAAAGALAFALDAILPGGSARSWVPALALAALAVARLLLADDVTWVADGLPGLSWLILATIMAAYVLALLRTRSVASTGDATGEPLSPRRVRAGMLVGALAACWFMLTTGGADARPEAPLFACLAGVAAGSLVRR
jgi:hypothetical protein